MSQHLALHPLPQWGTHLPAVIAELPKSGFLDERLQPVAVMPKFDPSTSEGLELDQRVRLSGEW